MCQITIGNLGGERYNKLFFLLAGSTGSLEHDDGWGYILPGEAVVKSHLPLHSTFNAGSMLWDTQTPENNGIFLGHIRQASPKVPVCVENSHPFTLDGVTFVHNGKLTPFDEKKFDMEIKEEVYDEKTKATIAKYISRSDSLIFFEEFMKNFKENGEPDLQKKFVVVFTETMKLFYGTFAMVFLIEGVYFVVRGKTKELNITYILGEKNENLGWAVNTSSKVLDFSTNLLSNLIQMEDGTTLKFSKVELVPEETIFVAEESGLTKIGEIKESYAPATYYSSWQGAGAKNFTEESGKKNGGMTSTGKKTAAAKYAEMIYQFQIAYSLTLKDIHTLLMICYDASMKEVQEHYIKNFCEVVIPAISKSIITKEQRKAMKKALCNFTFGIWRYDKDIQYPWFFNDEETQKALVAKIESEGKK